MQALFKTLQRWNDNGIRLGSGKNIMHKVLKESLPALFSFIFLKSCIPGRSNFENYSKSRDSDNRVGE